ncbi:kinesin-related protein, partial [Fragilariopsis cylindrus CCMP1102]
KRWFELDAVLDGKSTQNETYIKSGAQQAVTKDIFKGFNCTILAYGQTGSGKTFTMGSAASAGIDDHDDDDDDDDDDASDTTTSNEIGDLDGIIPRACADLFNHIRTRCDGNAQVELSYLEIYNEEMRDLLVVELKIRETLNGEVYVGGLSSRPVSSPKEIGKFMEEASKRRVTASTKMNAESSRSHAICVLQIKGVLEDSTKFQAKLTLVDLAGSERIKKTGAEGGRRQEGININKGLFVLGQVVSALSETRPKYKRKPPYRDSKLTRLLQDSLGGNSRTIMVACVSPADFNLDETITTLRYATNARNIKN